MVISHRFSRVVVEMAIRFTFPAHDLHIVESLDEALRILPVDTDPA